MSATTPALLAASAGVAFGHAILPDHWLTLAALGRTRRYPLARMVRLSGLAGVAHVLMSIVLGGVLIAIGLQLRSVMQDAQDIIVGCLLISTGVGFILLELTGHGHSHDSEHGHSHAHPHPPHTHPEASDAKGKRSAIAIIVPFGAAASPDLTILPVFLAATTAGVATALSSLLIFAAVTVLTIVGLTLLACFGGYRIGGRWLERWGNAMTALVMLVIGALVLTGVI